MRNILPDVIYSLAAGDLGRLVRLLAEDRATDCDDRGVSDSRRAEGKPEEGKVNSRGKSSSAKVGGR